MQDLVMSLSKASVRLALDGWDRDLELDFQDDNYTVLTGRNAGGKTLALKCLADFCEYLSEPSRYKFERLTKFLMQGGGDEEARILESLETQFEYEWMNYGEAWDSLSDASSIKWYVLQQEEDLDTDVKVDLSTLASRLLVDEDNIGHYNPKITSSIIAQNRIRFVKGQGKIMTPASRYVLERRDGIRFNLSQRKNEGGETISIDSEEIFEEWREIGFPFEEELHTFGPWDERGHKWMDEIENRLGLYFDREALVTASEETYDFHKTESMLRFKISPVEWRSVSEAYILTRMEKDEINEIVISWDDWYFEHMGRIFLDEFENNLAKYSDPRSSEMVTNMLGLGAMQYFRTNVCVCDGWSEIETETEDEEGNPFEIKEVNCKGCAERLELKPTNRNVILTHVLSWRDICDDQYPVKDDQHCMELWALVDTIDHFLEKEFDLNDELGPMDRILFNPEINHEWLEAYRDGIREEAIEEAYSFAHLFTKRRFTQAAIQGWPIFGLAKAVRMYFDDEIPEYLSSGQSRLLSMFSGLAEYPEGSVLMIDEPELSLHIDWQEGLISNLSELFPHLNFIIATHSPNVIMEHTEKVLEVPPRDIA